MKHSPQEKTVQLTIDALKDAAAGPGTCVVRQARPRFPTLSRTEPAHLYVPAPADDTVLGYSYSALGSLTLWNAGRAT